MQLEKQSLVLKAKEMQSKNQLDVYNHQADLERARIDHRAGREDAHLDFTAKMAGLINDLHKHENPQKVEKHSE